MRYVRLAPTGLCCSALGFGCANLMGRVSRRQSLRALAAAYDHGITVFDTARSYGWGESEAVLGEFARGRRDRIVIITKFGILPPPRNRLKNFLKPAARGLLSLAARLRLKAMTGAVRGQIRQRLSSQVQYGQFDVNTARESLNASLKALRTDVIDILFLHGPQHEVVDDKLIDYLNEVISAGKVRTIGVSADAFNADRIIEKFPAVRVIQIENNLLNQQIDALREKNQLGIITNRPFGGQSLCDRLAEVVAAVPAKATYWAEQTGIDVCSPEGISTLLLTYAFAANPAGVVVCGMHQADHIARNAALAELQPPDHDAFRQAVEDIRQLTSQTGQII